MDINQLIARLISAKASDIVLKTGARPRFRLHGELRTLKDSAVITEKLMASWISQVFPKRLQDRLDQSGDVDFSFLSGDEQRVRVNLYKQRQVFCMAVRVIPKEIPSFDDLSLPESLKEIALTKRGLILVTGATGSGKSTTLAAMVNHINLTRRANIITVEDPIEFDYVDAKSTVSQREMGLDVDSFPGALRSALRQNPDVIMVGELRDRETAETALRAAETGHLVLSTMHTSDSVETMTRVMSYFPADRHQMVRMQLSGALRAVVSQRLVLTRDKVRRVPANEILVSTSSVKEILLRGEHFVSLYDAIKMGKETYGMQSFDDCLLDLYQKNLVSSREALKNATRPNDLRMRLTGITG